MNALTGTENLIKQPSILNCPYWAAYADKVEDKNRLRDNYNSDGTIESAEKSLRDFVTDMEQSGCNTVFWFSEKPSPTKSGYRVPFYMPSKNPVQNNNSISGFAGVQPNESINDYVGRLVSEGIDKYKRDERFKELEQENKELKREIDGSPLNRVINRICGAVEPILPQLLTNVLPMNPEKAAAAATSVATVSGAENEDQRQKLAENALIRLANKREDLPELLERLAKLAETNPGMFETAINFLPK